MSFKEVKTKVKITTLKSGEPGFFINNGISLVPRASFSIKNTCPENYKGIIMEAIAYGWLVPVAHMKTSDYVWEKLGE